MNEEEIKKQFRILRWRIHGINCRIKVLENIEDEQTMHLIKELKQKKVRKMRELKRLQGQCQHQFNRYHECTICCKTRGTNY